MHNLITRNQANNWLAANPTPAPAQLRAFLDNEPHVLPQPATALSPGLLRTVGLLLLAVLLLLVVAATFFLFGERRERQPLQPSNSPQGAQRYDNY